MVAVRRSGGPGRGASSQEWRGAQVLEAWTQQIGTGVQTLASDILDDLHQTIHEITGEMRRQAFADVSVNGTKRTIRAGSAVDYAIYEELRHPQIRQVIDRQAPRLTQMIAAARGGA
jgi:hypothetical protein